jgi:peptidoglycan/xylan/chitin deacetylase (PgdA/CDA1 family)
VVEFGRSTGDGPAPRVAFALATGLHFSVGVSLVLPLIGVALYLAWLYLPDVGRAPTRGRTGGGRVALTFDDGPGPDTERVLDTLARHGARATFFCVGEAARRRPDLVHRLVAAGHVVGNHTLEHKKLPWLSRAEVVRQIDAAQAALVAAGAPPPTLFRAPHGWKSPFLGRALAQRGLRLVAWTRGVWDTERPGAEVIACRSLRALRDGAILLFHDGGGDRAQTAEALDAILTACARRGLRPVTLPEILERA